MRIVKGGMQRVGRQRGGIVAIQFDQRLNQIRGLCVSSGISVSLEFLAEATNAFNTATAAEKSDNAR